MSEIYFVVGGLFTDTNFDVIEGGKKITRLGPFDNYEQAQAVWRAKAMETVDEAYAKFSIERNCHDEYWVVGGRYTETDFKTIRDGGKEERIGPFDDLEEARSKWKAKSMDNIDDAYCRYRIEKL